MMDDPHNPERVLWKAYTSQMDIWAADPHNKSAKENADYYYDQWFKVVEKRVVSELQRQKVKDTVADKKKITKPKPDKLSSK